MPKVRSRRQQPADRSVAGRALEREHVGRSGHLANRRRGRLRIGPTGGRRAISRGLASRSSAIGHLARA
jgi:hypothetical protein